MRNFHKQTSGIKLLCKLRAIKKQSYDVNPNQSRILKLQR